ncbi:unnamed protein product, partial [marine sediment metagenome]
QEKKGPEFCSKDIFLYSIENYIEFARSFLIKKKSKKILELTCKDINSVIYDDMKNQMRNSKLIIGDYGPSKFPEDKWQLNINL